MRNAGHIQYMQRLCLRECFLPFRDVIKYGLGTFYNFKGCLFNKNILLRFNCAQKNLPKKYGKYLATHGVFGL